MNDKWQQAQVRQMVLRMYDAGDSLDEIQEASGLGRSWISQMIIASGRDVAFRPYGKPDSKLAKEFAMNWIKVTRMVREKLARRQE